jgi:integrase
MSFPDLGAVFEAHRAFLDGADDLLFSMPTADARARRFRKRYRRASVKKALAEHLHALRFHGLRRTFRTLLWGADIGIEPSSQHTGQRRSKPRSAISIFHSAR